MISNHKGVILGAILKPLVEFDLEGRFPQVN